LNDFEDIAHDDGNNDEDDSEEFLNDRIEKDVKLDGECIRADLLESEAREDKDDILTILDLAIELWLVLCQATNAAKQMHQNQQGIK